MPNNSESFEHALAELEDIVSQMESGEISLEASLEKFERGIKLVRASQQQLSNAEQKVKILLSNDAEAELSDFDKDSDA
jgi:exodeoxyribonuclease VII small subunit